MNESIQFAIHDQLERVADGLDQVGALLERLAMVFETMGFNDDSAKKSPPVSAPPLSLFFESLPTWLYNNFRRKNIPAHLAASIIGQPQGQLARLAEMGMIHGKAGRYDLMDLLGYLEDTLSDYGHHDQADSNPVFKQ